MAREGILSDSKFEKIPELPGAVARILDRGMTADRSLQWLEMAFSQTPNLKRKKIVDLPGATSPVLPSLS